MTSYSDSHGTRPKGQEYNDEEEDSQKETVNLLPNFIDGNGPLSCFSLGCLYSCWWIKGSIQNLHRRKDCSGVCKFTACMANSFFARALLVASCIVLLAMALFSATVVFSGEAEPRSFFSIGRERSRECQVDKNDMTGMALDVISLWKKAEKGKPRILCLVFATNKENHARARMVKETWGADCDRLLIISNEDDPSLPTVKTQQSVPDTYKNLHHKVIWAFHYAWQNYREEFDWIYKADDDTYVVIDNLRQLLLSPRYSQLPSTPRYTGRRFAYFGSSPIYTSGGSGYVLNKAALQKLVEEGFPSPSEIETKGLCKLKDNWPYKPSDYPEDVMVGWCLNKQTIYPEDARDENMRERFHWSNPAAHYAMSYNGDDWHVQFTKPFGIYHTTGQDYFSNSTISFHYVSDPKLMQRIYKQLTRCNREKN